MSTSISIRGFTGKDSEIFKKHYNAVKFCIENDLSFPKETREFFKGKVDGDDIEVYSRGCLLDKIKNGIDIELPIHKEDFYEYYINVSDIPKECDIIKIELE